MMEKIILLNKMQEKKVGRGEDSDPILFHDDNVIVIGVFDGMGGAGGAECNSDYTTGGQLMTKAYIGSRIVRDAIETAIKQNSSIVFQRDFSQILKQIIVERYAQEKEKYPPKSTVGLRSALIKEYPTTLAITTVFKDKGSYHIDSYWAGDSRNYLWTIDGLFQISTDDLKGNLDPLQNLHEDAPMSNCIQADGPFIIRHKRVEISDTQKFAVVSATDGCFGYFPSPMDFYKVLCDTLQNSDSKEQWEEKLCNALALVTADDFSFSIAVVGYRQFKDFKKEFRKANNTLRKYFDQRNAFEKKVRKCNRLENEISTMKDKLNVEIESIWPEYKKTYLKYMIDNEER